MNVLRILFIGFVFAATVQADQPRIIEAHNRLEKALKHVLSSTDTNSKNHIDKAIVDLEIAKTSLENAQKNKGSHTHVAIKKIEAAIKEVEFMKQNLSNRDTAIAQIKSALKEVEEAKRAGTR
jgi:hypothetical protein